MDIKQEVIDDLNAVISITVSPEDYQGKVKTIINLLGNYVCFD